MLRYCAMRALDRAPGRRSASAAMSRTAFLPDRPSATPACRTHGVSVPGRSDALALLRQVVDEQVLAEPVRARVQRAALVDARHPLDEGAQARAVVQHEGIDGDAAAGDALDLAERLLGGAHADAAEGERPLAVEPPAQEIGRRLAVGGDGDVLVVARGAGEGGGRP